MEKYFKIKDYSKKILSIDITDEQIFKFKRYKELLLDWNNKVNLTAITDEEDIIKKHFIDSISCVESGIIKENSKIIDVGTGAGFPSIPLKIIRPDLQITLLDSLNKRVNFLNEVIYELNLENVKAVHGRAEDFGKDLRYRETYDIAVSRAVASLNILLEYCLPLVRVNGFFISMKGPAVEKEIDGAKNALDILGGTIHFKKDIESIDTDINHTLIIIKKIKKCPAKYPRKSGTPTKKPL